ncbi:periplasmic heavy metal sensor [Labilibaculum sp. DW002]|jgi:Spy/CpxP family protein refolding chaperone|uniref:Periplasmic heavy metal sensor n=1 Tax=Paralabilibaculum antarcticum TaxID=2912572 RepID=A0ABT5VNF6_9BACT|nr:MULTISPECIES: periplasmic heavy metal sensor [unclassified Labilibaculum]MBI9059927.1 periplasmic heavy metal sensor [Labilibaculum sp.]MDE5416978.1 periplasmic heavy metal sensor [Labilibaculum sp. DW002]
MNSKNKTWMWLALILLATNISTIGSFWYHTYQEKQVSSKVELPTEYRTRFLKEQLDLNEEQKNAFRILNRSYNRNANEIMIELNDLRSEMVQYLGEEQFDSIALRSVAEQIGKKHEALKLETVQFYQDMKAELNENQQAKLYDLFSSLLQKSDEVNIPKGKRKGRGKGRGPWHQNQ